MKTKDMTFLCVLCGKEGLYFSEEPRELQNSGSESAIFVVDWKVTGLQACP
jgi:hypothetical protein